MRLAPHDAGLYLDDQNFIAACEPGDLVYFVLNQGNADTQLLVLPEENGVRDFVVVDAGRTGATKLIRLIEDLSDPTIGAPPLRAESRLRLIVATHPHDDHIAGVPSLMESFPDRIDTVWDAGFFYRNGAWHEMMAWIEDHPGVNRVHPTAGTRLHLGQVTIMALSPAIELRNNYDTRGVHVNNASISLLVEFPANRVFTGDPDTFATGRQQVAGRRRRLLLGADAQTTSWAHVDVDFPPQAQERAAELRQLGHGSAREPLSADVFKVPHHCSKNGLSTELVARVNPTISLISSDASETSHAFPHEVAINQLREALQPIAGGRTVRERKGDHELGIYCTANEDDGGGVLGSIGVIVKPQGHRVDVFRFGDSVSSRIERGRLTSSRQVAVVPSRSSRTTYP